MWKVLRGCEKKCRWLPIGTLVVRTLHRGGHPPRLSQSLRPRRGTEPSHCSFLQTMHRQAPIASNGLNLCFQ